MDIRILRYFLAVAREENITRAAENLHISQPSLSKQLLELERDVGKQLLIRGKRKITLTETGVLLRKRAEEMITLMEKTEHELKEEGNQLSGEVIIGGNPTLSVLETVAAVRKKHPGIHFQFYCSDAIDVMERLEHGSLDFAIFLEPIDAMKYEYIPLMDVSHWGVLMPIDCALANKTCIQKEDLFAIPLVLHRRAGLQRLISRWADTEIENMNITATYNVINGSAEKFVKSGLGYCLTTEDLLPAKLDDALTFSPLEPALDTHYALVWKRYAVFSKAAEAVLQAFRE